MTNIKSTTKLLMFTLVGLNSVNATDYKQQNYKKKKEMYHNQCREWSLTYLKYCNNHEKFTQFFNSEQSSNKTEFELTKTEFDEAIKDLHTMTEIYNKLCEEHKKLNEIAVQSKLPKDMWSLDKFWPSRVDFMKKHTKRLDEIKASIEYHEGYLGYFCIWKSLKKENRRFGAKKEENNTIYIIYETGTHNKKKIITSTIVSGGTIIGVIYGVAKLYDKYKTYKNKSNPSLKK